ncbi:hypothetical protein NEDG_01918 [Nematocida displodere]|uniref:Uncharacterized protein n=1 Tax=Nematocida displodere TaxID=1805483 RepID=A0A177EGQ2_9MICR|nr:hypothetical protein NEDG_01918 [Nematocida displodere]
MEQLDSPKTARCNPSHNPSPAYILLFLLALSMLEAEWTQCSNDLDEGFRPKEYKNARCLAHTRRFLNRERPEELMVVWIDEVPHILEPVVINLAKYGRPPKLHIHNSPFDSNIQYQSIEIVGTAKTAVSTEEPNSSIVDRDMCMAMLRLFGNLKAKQVMISHIPYVASIFAKTPLEAAEWVGLSILSLFFSEPEPPIYKVNIQALEFIVVGPGLIDDIFQIWNIESGLDNLFIRRYGLYYSMDFLDNLKCPRIKNFRCVNCPGLETIASTAFLNCHFTDEIQLCIQHDTGLVTLSEGFVATVLQLKKPLLTAPLIEKKFKDYKWGSLSQQGPNTS